MILSIQTIVVSSYSNVIWIIAHLPDRLLLSLRSCLITTVKVVSMNALINHINKFKNLNFLKINSFLAPLDDEVQRFTISLTDLYIRMNEPLSFEPFEASLTTLTHLTIDCFNESTATLEFILNFKNLQEFKAIVNAQVDYIFIPKLFRHFRTLMNFKKLSICKPHIDPNMNRETALKVLSSSRNDEWYPRVVEWTFQNQCILKTLLTFNREWTELLFQDAFDLFLVNVIQLFIEKSVNRALLRTFSVCEDDCLECDIVYMGGVISAQAFEDIHNEK